MIGVVAVGFDEVGAEVGAVLGAEEGVGFGLGVDDGDDSCEVGCDGLLSLEEGGGGDEDEGA